MAGNLARINLSEAWDAIRQFLEDEGVMHEQFVDEFTARNRGRWDEYVSRNRSLWSRLLGRLREAGVDAPEAFLGSAAILVMGAALSFTLASKKKY